MFVLATYTMGDFDIHQSNLQVFLVFLGTTTEMRGCGSSVVDGNVCVPGTVLGARDTMMIKTA